MESNNDISRKPSSPEEMAKALAICDKEERKNELAQRMLSERISSFSVFERFILKIAGFDEKNKRLCDELREEIDGVDQKIQDLRYKRDSYCESGDCENQRMITLIIEKAKRFKKRIKKELGENSSFNPIQTG